MRYLGDFEHGFVGPQTGNVYYFGPERREGYVWVEDAWKFVPEGAALGAAMFERVTD